MKSVNAEVIPFPEQRRERDYSLGFSDGLKVGSKLANERFFWYGTLAGVGIAGLIAVVLIRFFS